MYTTGAYIRRSFKIIAQHESPYYCFKHWRICWLCLFDLHILDRDERTHTRAREGKRGREDAVDLNLLHNQLHVRWLISFRIKA